MAIDRDATGSWRYYVHDGRVFCPRLSADVDVADCSACIYLESDPASGFVACLPPPGRSIAEMIEAVARY